MMFLSPRQPAPAHSADAAVRSTDSDALLSRVSAANQGYLTDPFAALFLAPAQRRSPERRPPLINIGTHARTWALDELVDQFLRSAEDSQPQVREQRTTVQVLSLGAGADTRFWRMRKRWDERRGAASWPCRRWVEVDFPEATGAKARTVSSKAELREALGGEIKIEQGGLGLTSSLYAVLPGDLRDLATLASSLLSPPRSPSTAPPLLDPSLPTLLLLECVLVYLSPSATDGILSWFANTFKDGSSVSYDPFGLHDSFGQVMKRNLATRGLTLPGADSTPTLDSLTQRLRSNGFEGPAHTLSIKQIRSEGFIPAAELERVNKIEQIDEVEELNLVLDHYAVTWGTVGAPPEEERPRIALAVHARP
ncbi:hypothetical protein JCM1841_004586 [Sporobolomyces salmonicolor]